MTVGDDDEQEPSGHVRVTGPGPLVVLGLVGLVLGWGLRRLALADGRPSPSVGWTLIGVTWFVLAITAGFADALRMAGATRYGLQAGIYTDSVSRVREAFDRLDVGAIIVNDVPSARVDAMPYGGRRDSGIGREGVRYAIEEMTDRKMLVVRG